MERYDCLINQSCEDFQKQRKAASNTKTGAVVDFIGPRTSKAMLLVLLGAFLLRVVNHFDTLSYTI